MNNQNPLFYDNGFNAKEAPSESLSIHQIIDTVKSGIYTTDLDGNITFVNQSFVDILGYNNKEEILGFNLTQKLYAHPSDREEFLQKLNKKGYVIDYEVKSIKKGGRVMTLSVTSNYIRNTQGHIMGIEGVVEDITHRKKLEEKLIEEKVKLEKILSIDEKLSELHDLNQLVDFIIEKATEILQVKRCSLMFVDHDSEELLIKGARGLHDETIREVRVKLGDPIAGLVAKEGKPLLVTNIELADVFSRKNRSTYKSKSFMSVPIKIGNRLVGVINVSDKLGPESDVFSSLDLKVLCAIVRQAAVAIENANLYKEMHFLSNLDVLTKLYNHRYFVMTLEREICRLKRYPSALCVMMVDIDNFKPYNDLYGHLQGDILLQDFGKILIQNLREIDTPCRFGGDEFAVILPGNKTAEARNVAEKLQTVMEGLHLRGNISLSVGISSYVSGMDRYDLVFKAEQALYRAKKEGKNRICVYD